MRKRFAAVLVLALACWLGSTAPAQEKKLKVYISVDMEGIGDVVTRDQTSPQGFEYAQARKWMTAEANAAIAGAFEAGATEVLVSDSHGNALNLLADELDPRARLIRAWPRKLIMMDGIDESFDAVIFIGYHASAGKRHTTLAHTMSSARIYHIKLNGIEAPEGGFNAAIAGHFDVPVVMISGDQTVIAEVRAQVGPIEAAEVKHGSGVVAVMMHPTKAQELIREKAKAALARLKDFKPWKLQAPITLEVAFKWERDAELAGMIPGAKMLDGRTVQFTGKDMVELAGLVEVITNLETGR
jgi:D-amino peptidase